MFKKNLKNSKPYHQNKRELESSFDISNETSLSKIKFNMLNLNNNGSASGNNNYENSSNQSVVSNETDSEDNKLDASANN